MLENVIPNCHYVIENDEGEIKCVISPPKMNEADIKSSLESELDTEITDITIAPGYHECFDIDLYTSDDSFETKFIASPVACY